MIEIEYKYDSELFKINKYLSVAYEGALSDTYGFNVKNKSSAQRNIKC